MPRSTTIRKDRQDLNRRGPAPERLEVHQSMNVVAPRKDHSRLLQALAGFAQEKQSRDNAKYSALGERDANLGQADEALADHEAYVRTFNARKGFLDASQAISAARAGLEDAYRASVDLGEEAEFDFDEYFQNNIAHLYEGKDDTDYLTAANGAIGRARDELRVRFAAMQAEQMDQQSLDMFQGQLLTSVADGSIQSIEDLNAIIENPAVGAEAAGLTFNEIEQSIGQAALSRLGMNDTKLYDLFMEKYGEKDDVMGRWKARLDTAKQAADKRIEAEQQAGENLQASERIKRLYAFQQQANKGQLAEADMYAALDRGELSDGEVKGLLGDRDRAIDERLAREARRQRVNQVIADPISISRFSETEQNEISEDFEEIFSTASENLRGLAKAIASDPDNPDLQVALTRWHTDNLPYIRVAQGMGHTPRAVKKLLEVRSTSAPQFQAAASVMQMLESLEGGNPFKQIDVESATEIREYNAMVNSGVDPDVAIEHIKSRVNDLTLPQARRHLMQDTQSLNNLNSAVEELTSSAFDLEDKWFGGTDVQLQSIGRVRQLIEDVATREFRVHGSREKAFENAVQYVKDNYEPVRGAWLPKDHVPEGFGKAFEGYQDVLKEQFESAGLEFPEGGFLAVSVPTTHMDGRILLAPADDPSDFLRDKNGRILYLSPSSVMSTVQERTPVENPDDRRKATFENAQTFQSEMKALEDGPYSHEIGF